MAEKTMLNIVATACQPKDEVKFNKWYNEVHIPMILKYRGVTGAARYRIASESSAQPKYIALYKFASQKEMADFSRSPEFLAAMKEMKETWGNNEIEIKYTAAYELIQEWGK